MLARQLLEHLGLAEFAVGVRLQSASQLVGCAVCRQSMLSNLSLGSVRARKGQRTARRVPIGAGRIVRCDDARLMGFERGEWGLIVV